MIFEEMKKQADENYEDIKEILKCSDCSLTVWRYDTDSCYLVRKDNDEIVWQADTESILKILEDICDVWYVSPRRRLRRIKRLREELKKEVEKYE